MRLGLDAGILAKGAMRHFWKIANRAFIAFAERFFVKVPGKISGEIVLGKFGDVDYCLSGILPAGKGSRAMRCGAGFMC